MKFILGVSCCPNEECFVLFFPEYIKSIVPMNQNYGIDKLIRGGKYGIGEMNRHLETPTGYRNHRWY